MLSLYTVFCASIYIYPGPWIFIILQLFANHIIDFWVISPLFLLLACSAFFSFCPQLKDTNDLCPFWKSRMFYHRDERDEMIKLGFILDFFISWRVAWIACGNKFNVPYLIHHSSIPYLYFPLPGLNLQLINWSSRTPMTIRASFCTSFAPRLRLHLQETYKNQPTMVQLALK